MKPEPTGTPDAVQTSDTVQNSALGAVNPQAQHPDGGRLVPVSAATPDDVPMATRESPPQTQGHDIGKAVENSSTTPAVPYILRDGVWVHTVTGEPAPEGMFEKKAVSAPELPHASEGVPPLTPKSVTTTGH